MKLHKKVEKTFFLELSESELKEVKALLQNPIGHTHPVNELPGICSLRTKLFKILSTEIPDKLSIDQQFNPPTYTHEELW